MGRRTIGAGLLAASLAVSACSSTPRATDDIEGLRETIDELYAAFCFDAEAEPDWATQRRIYLEGAAFVRPARAGATPIADDLETFLTSFREWAILGEHAPTGLHERIIGVRVDGFGGVAHAFVAFEGFHPGDGEAVTRGLDSLVFVRDGERWRLASFATQYEGEGLTMPPRFRD